MRLHYQEQGPPRGRRPPVLLLHGLLGSSANWRVLAGQLADRGIASIAPDLRNHGASPHDPGMDYPLMTGDVVRLLDDLEVDRVEALGHSMGAKVAMWLALRYPDRVSRLISVDMAPTRSPNRFGLIFDSLLSLDLGCIDSRQAADEHLARALDNPLLRRFLLRNLLREGDHWRWRVNLRVLDAALERILDFPLGQEARPFQGEALFLYGGASDYVTSASGPAIQSLFPYARLRAVPGAGHWVHADQPEAFRAAVLRFLRNRILAQAGHN
jgi:esterase